MIISPTRHPPKFPACTLSQSTFSFGSTEDLGRCRSDHADGMHTRRAPRLLAWLTSALFGARVSGHRLAVCISGELRSAVCSPRTAVRGSGLAAPLETIARLLSQIGERDVFVAIDEPPSASNNANVAEGGTAALRSLAESDARTARLLARIAPISVEHSVQQTEAQYWDEARQALCVKSAAVFQARKLRSCWQRILAREAQLRFAYTHVLRLRPDLLVPDALADTIVRALQHQGRHHVPQTQLSASMDESVAGLRLLPPRHTWGAEICLRTHTASGTLCQAQCTAPSGADTSLSLRPTPSTSQDLAGTAGGMTLAPFPSEAAHVLTLPPFTSTLKNDTYVNDVFWLADRAVAAPLFDPLSTLTAWSANERGGGGTSSHMNATPAASAPHMRQAVRARNGVGASATDGGAPGEVGGLHGGMHADMDVDPLCGLSLRLRAVPSCVDDGRFQASRMAPTCATGGHECMLSHAVALHLQSAEARPAMPGFRHRRTGHQQHARSGSVREGVSLRVRYLAEAKLTPQVLRLAETDERQCGGMQLAYLCSEKRKVRHVPTAASSGSTGGNSTQAAGAGGGAASREMLRRCKQADRMRVQVKTRLTALQQPNRQS